MASTNQRFYQLLKLRPAMGEFKASNCLLIKMPNPCLPTLPPLDSPPAQPNVFNDMAAAENVSPELLANLGLHNAEDIEALRGFVCRPLGTMVRRSSRSAKDAATKVNVDNVDMVKEGLEVIATIGAGKFLTQHIHFVPSLLPIGNCFFAAISDQFYGNWDHAAEYRALSVKYLQDNKDKFIDFMVINQGGGTRRNPKRKNTGGYSVSVDHGSSTMDAMDLQFKNELIEMTKVGTFADEIQIRALAEALGINIRIFRTGYTIEVDGAPGKDTPIAAVAHENEHYCTVRKIGQPRTGPARLGFRIAQKLSESVEPQSPIQLASTPTNHLLPEELVRSRSSTPGSVSIERDNEDEDEEFINPAKRAATVRKIRTPTSRKPSKLSKRISAAPTPSRASSRAGSPDAVIVVGEAVKNTANDCEETSPLPPADKSQSATKVFPSPPTSGPASSPAPIVITIEDSDNDDDDEDDIPLSPRRRAQRRRSSKLNQKGKAQINAIVAKVDADGKKKVSKKAPSPLNSVELAKEQSKTKRMLKRGTRGGKTTAVEEA